MAATHSTMIPLGTLLPDFQLTNGLDANLHTPASVMAEHGVLVVFMCNHCPYVKHILPHWSEMANTYRRKGIGVIAISSNDVNTHPDDSPEKMKALAEEYQFEFPYVYDETQSVAKSFNAACTPDFFLFNSEGRLVYRGQYDESRPGNGKPVTGSDLRGAMNALIAGDKVNENQIPAIGCNIKWKV